MQAEKDSKKVSTLDFSAKTEKLCAKAKLSFYEFLAHTLTIAIRSIWSDTEMSDAEKVERMKRIKEIMHRAIAKVRVLRLGLREWSEHDFETMVKNWIGDDSRLRGELSYAIKHSYHSVVDLSTNDSSPPT